MLHYSIELLDLQLYRERATIRVLHGTRNLESRSVSELSNSFKWSSHSQTSRTHPNKLAIVCLLSGHDLHFVRLDEEIRRPRLCSIDRRKTCVEQAKEFGGLVELVCSCVSQIGHVELLPIIFKIIFSFSTIFALHGQMQRYRVKPAFLLWDIR